MKKILYILMLVCTLSAQMQPERVENMFDNITTGFFDTYRWYDILFVAAYQDPQFINESNIGDKVSFPPFGFDENLFGHYTIDRELSLGSMDKDIIPSTFFYSRLAATTLLNVYTGMEITPESYHKLFLFHKALLYQDVFAILAKGLIKRSRPDGSNNRSFFSSHTSTTFAFSTYLFLELHDAYDEWYLTRNSPVFRTSLEIFSSAALFGWAGYVAYSRVYDRKHYLSDVIVGAAVGSAIAYFLYENHFDDKFDFLNYFSVAKFNERVAISFNLKLQ